MINPPKSDQDYANLLAPHLLNAICDLAESKPSKKVLKRYAFEACRADGSKGDSDAAKRLPDLRHTTLYHRDINNAVDVLITKYRFVTRNVNPAYVNITDDGVRMCNTPVSQGGWHRDIYGADKLDPSILRIK